MKGLAKLLSPRAHPYYHGDDGIDVRRWDNEPPAGGGGKGPVTQEAIDRIYGDLMKEKDKVKIISDKLSKAEEDKVLILSRIRDIELKNNPPIKKKPINTGRISDQYDENNLPQSEEEWTALYDENPGKATDLRTHVSKARDEHEKEFKSCVDELKQKHPDMYLRDEKGNFILDKNGNVQPDTASEKFKIFDDIAGKDPTILRVKNGPRIVMQAMEGRLRGVDEAKVKADLEAKKAAEEARLKKIKDGQVADGGSGGAAPKDDDVKIEYTSDEEKAHVATAIKKGIYKDEKEYMKNRNRETIGYGRGGF